ncbi:MAG: membrane protein insertion efficiency factor YidD [Chitinispirillia bacterium]|nr:membrane protein insertion efficiency factor YidD [Chitinispirillia bacterium]
MAVVDYQYDGTVDASRQRSLEKALAIVESGQKKSKSVSERILERPNVSVVKGILVFAAVLLTLFFLCFYVMDSHIDSLRTRILIALTAGMIIFLVSAKRIAVWSILVYQKQAPDSIRLACVFEPSCSRYMLMAIEKYGVAHGLVKGIKRLLRCRHPNGGVDDP